MATYETEPRPPSGSPRTNCGSPRYRACVLARRFGPTGTNCGARCCVSVGRRTLGRVNACAVGIRPQPRTTAATGAIGLIARAHAQIAPVACAAELLDEARVVSASATTMAIRPPGLDRRDIPGKPDLTLPRHRKVIFVHGCFWHQHSACREGRLPSTNERYWAPKLARTGQRDAAALAELKACGWRALVLWDCEIEDETLLQTTLSSFLDGPNEAGQPRIASPELKSAPCQGCPYPAALLT